MLQMIKSKLSKLRNEDGVSAIEYALLAALIAVAIVGGASFLGNTINTKLSSIATQVGS